MRCWNARLKLLRVKTMGIGIAILVALAVFGSSSQAQASPCTAHPFTEPYQCVQETNRSYYVGNTSYTVTIAVLRAHDDWACYAGLLIQPSDLSRYNVTLRHLTLYEDPGARISRRNVAYSTGILGDTIFGTTPAYYDTFIRQYHAGSRFDLRDTDTGGLIQDVPIATTVTPAISCLRPIG
jgi:hypothetical protein